MISFYTILQTFIVCLISSLVSIFIVERYGSKLNYSKLEIENDILREENRSLWKCYRYLAKQTTVSPVTDQPPDQLIVYFSLSGKKFHQSSDCSHLGEDIVSTPLDSNIEYFAVNANLFCKSCANH